MTVIAGNLLTDNQESVETDASGWSALVNAGSLVRAAGGTLGSFSLRWQATAAGDSQVGIATRAAVTPGVTYWSAASVYMPFTGAQSRLEIRWYTSGGSLISTTQGPLVTAASANWGQVAASGVAPATAATALVVVRITATAASQSWFLDRALLMVQPAALTYNLFDWLTQAVEVDVSAWTGALNCAVAPYASSVDWYQSMAVTSVAAGDVQAYNVTRPAVTAGVEYIGYAWVAPSVSALTLHIELWWYDAGGTKLSESTSTWTPASATWTRCAAIATAPAGAASVRLVIRPTATAAGQLWACDRMNIAPTAPLNMTSNLLGYNTADFEQDLSGWMASGCTVAQSTSQVFNGAYALKATATGSGDLTLTLVTRVPVTPGASYQVSPAAWRAGTKNFRSRLTWYNASGQVIRSRAGDWAGSSSTWFGGPASDIAPPGAATLLATISVPGSAAGEVWYFDRIYVGPGGLTVQAVPAAGGGAQLTLSGLTTGGPTWTYTLQRLGADGSVHPVRGPSGDIVSVTPTGDLAVVTDYEAPLGVPVSWLVRSVGPTGSMSYISDPLTLDPPPDLCAWVKDPLNPIRSAALTVATLPDWQRAARQGVSTVRGAALPIVISDVRSGRTGALTLVTETAEEATTVAWICETGGTLLIQWHPDWAMEDMYAQVGDLTEAHVSEYGGHHDRLWTLPLTEVSRPVGGVTGAADRTWQTVRDGYADWYTVLTKYASWLDVRTGTEI
ncbi:MULTISPECIES: hypothetical protein [unclassified Streptomyces]|uniref:hypothetical protein n=1 Tax=unclassified Streptomyces TaxID=2593676 RepID=UPI0033D4A7D0